MLGRRVFLGDTFVEWREARDEQGQRTCACAVGQFSGDSVSGHSESVTAFISQPLFNEPGNEKESNVLENTQEDLTISCIEPELQSVESREDLTLSCIEPELQSVESSISHLLVNDPDNEKEINALENTQISTVDFDFEDEEWTEDEEEYTDNVVKDPDFTIRTTSTLLGRDVETYGVITPGEEVFDHDMQGGEEDDDDNIEFPDEVKVNHSGDIKDEQCFIVYKKNLLQLVTFLLHLPEEMKCREPECTSTVRLGPDPVTKSVGSGMVLKWYCSDGHLLWRWCSQPTFKYDSGKDN
ncbi:unnamed protein product [Arctogadus glacialis]